MKSYVCTFVSMECSLKGVHLIIVQFLLCFAFFADMSGQGRVPSFDPNNSNRGTTDQFSVTDTIDRPLLTYSKYNLHDDIRTSISDLDSTIRDIHVVEPYYKSYVLTSNLGSEYSASLPLLKVPSFNGNTTGFFGFTELFRQTYQPSVKEVNRVFWFLDYAQSTRIGSSQLKTSIYKPFARNIDLNFTYMKFEDNGRFGAQSNAFKRMDIKLVQKSKSGNRITYVHYDSPTMEDSFNPEIIGRSTSNTSGSMSFSRSKNSIVLGNSFIKTDTATSKPILEWNTRLSSNSDQLNATAQSLTRTGKDLIALDLVDDTLSYYNNLNGISLFNELIFYKTKSEIKTSIDLKSQSFKVENVVDDKLFDGLLHASYFYNLETNVRLGIVGNVGFFDASGAYDIATHLDYNKHNLLDLNVAVALRQSLPLLEQRQIAYNSQLSQSYNWQNIQGVDLTVKGKYLPTNTNFNLSYGRYKNLITMGGDLFYNQDERSSNILSVQLEQELNVGPIYSSHVVHLQSITSKLFAPIPFQYSGELYVRKRLFKKKMNVQFGLNFHFIPSFDTPEFLPLSGTFYNYDITTNSGNIFLINPYLSAKVDQLFFFIKGVNVLRQRYPQDPNTLNNVYSEYLSSYSPLYESRIRFGVKWTLLD